MQIRTHLFLVHEGLIPNITPALDPRFRPSEVCLLAAPQMRRQTERLARILREAGVSVGEWPLDDAWDIEHVRERVLAFLAERAGDDIALNASGGTRPMSLAAYEVFRYADKPVYYVHPERDHVVWLHPRELASFDLADRIRLPAFLAAHDLRLVSAVRQGVAEPLRDLTATLVRQVEHFAPALAILNWYAGSAKRRSLVSPTLTGAHLQVPQLRELLDLFSSNTMLQVTADDRLHFANEAARFYVNGGWLEEHVFSVLQRLRHELPLQDLARSLVVEWDEKGSPVENEIDVVFLADNRLYLIECKTKKFDKDQSPESQIAATLYKLDTLRDYLGGAGARAMLISYCKLGKAAQDRAREFGIEMCEGQGVRRLEEALREWVRRKER